MSVEQNATTAVEAESITQSDERLGFGRFRFGYIQIGGAVLALTGLAAAALSMTASGNHDNSAHPGLPPAPSTFEPGLSTSAPLSQTPSRQPSISDAAPKVTPKNPNSATSTSTAPLGRLLSFHFESKSRGLSKDEQLLPMSCPTACKEVNGGPDFVLDPPSYYSLYYWKGDKRIIAGHTSEVPGVELAAQWFKDIRPGDTVTMHTTTGDVTYVDEKLPACAATTQKGSSEFSKVYGSLTKDQFLFLTCAITAKNDKNTIHIFNREGTSYSPQQFPCAASA